MGLIALADTVAQGAQEIKLMERLDPWMLVGIIIGALGALILSLFMVYSYINRIRTDEIRRQRLYDSVFDSRFRMLKEQLGMEGRSTGSGGEDPMWLEDQRRDLQGNLGRIQSKLAGLKERTNLSDKEQDELQDLQRQSDDITAHLEGGFAEDRITKVRAAAQQRDKERQDQIAKLRAEAHKQADMLIPPSLTVAGMGITGSFFIELTAILTIIFGIIILGLVGVLTSTEIAPILAAIAGYVLGKTTSGWAPYGGAASMQQPPTPQAAAPPSPKPGASSEAK